MLTALVLTLAQSAQSYLYLVKKIVPISVPSTLAQDRQLLQRIGMFLPAIRGH